MLNNPKELLDKIRLGEDSVLELKEVRFSNGRLTAPHRDGLADELAAFANTRGGVCVLGVEDKSRKILGIPEAGLDQAEEMVRNVCNDAIDPPLLAHIERMLMSGAEGTLVAVLKVEVPRSLFVHRSQTGLIRFDEQAVAGAKLDDLQPGLWQRFRTSRSRDSRPAFLAKMGLAKRGEEGSWRPTVTGVLVASEQPRRWLPNAFIQAVAYRGHSSVPAGGADLYQLDAKEITGPVDIQVIEACRFVLRNMKVAARKGPGRRDIPQFDMAAVFEALVNAVAHRDYSIYGSKIRLRLFSDRLELYSPGALPNTLDIDSLPYRQIARNETLTSMLARCPIPEELDWLKTDRLTLMDKRGEGVSIVLERSRRLSGKSPEYRLIDDAELLLTIYATPDSGSGGKRPEKRQ